jgi:YfiH family protein
MDFCDFRFFGSFGGVSEGKFKSLNCDVHSGDDLNYVMLNRRIVCNSFEGDNKLFMVNQSHTDEVFVLENYDDLDKCDEIECDAIITRLPSILLGISTADCAPIVFFDEKASVICCCHAGWRGAYSDLFKNILFIFENRFGSKVENINVVIGPMIQQDSYQVQQDFYDKWIEQDKVFDDFFEKREGGYYFDLSNAIVYKLMNLGIPQRNIDNTEIDTLSNNDYFSYRRGTLSGEIEKGSEVFGRNISVVKINK